MSSDHYVPENFLSETPNSGEEMNFAETLNEELDFDAAPPEQDERERDGNRLADGHRDNSHNAGHDAVGGARAGRTVVRGQARVATPDAAATGLIWTLLGIGLAACGGGGGGGSAHGTGTTSSTPQTASQQPASSLNNLVANAGNVGPENNDVANAAPADDGIRRVVDGPISGAKAFARNADGTRGDELGTTNTRGELQLTQDQIAQQYEGFIGDLTGATDVATGRTFAGGEFHSLAGSKLASPLTTLVKMAQDNADGDGDLSTAPTPAQMNAAQQKVIKMLFGTDAEISLGHINDWQSYSMDRVPDGGASPTLVRNNMIAKAAIQFLETANMLASFGGGMGFDAALAHLYNNIMTGAAGTDPATIGTLLGSPPDGVSQQDWQALSRDIAANVREMSSGAEAYASGRPFSLPKSDLQVFEDSWSPVDGELIRPVAGALAGAGARAAPAVEGARQANPEPAENLAPLRITLANFGYGDRNPNDALGAITLTSLDDLNGTLNFVAIDGTNLQLRAAGAEGRIEVKRGDDQWQDSADFRIIVDEIRPEIDGVRSFIYTPAPNFTGTAEIKFTLHDKVQNEDFDPDNTKTSAESVMTITVNPVNDTPTAVHSFTNGDNSATEAGHAPGEDEGAPIFKEGDSIASGGFTLNDVDSENSSGNLGVSIQAKTRVDDKIADADGTGGADARTMVARYARNLDNGANAANQPDVDTADVGEGLTIKGAYGTLAHNLANHSWHYELKNSWESVNTLKAGDKVQDVFTFTFTDSHGAQTKRDVSIAINGANDAPVLVVGEGNLIRSVRLNDTLETGVEIAPVEGTLRAIDPDAGSSATYSVAGAVIDNRDDGFTHRLEKDRVDFLFNATNGAYKIIPKVAAIDALGANENDVERYLVTARDNGGLTSRSAHIEVLLVGVDDTGVLSGRSTIRDTAATDPAEVLARFEISDPDTDYTANNGELVTLDGAEADVARFAVEVARKPGAGNENTYIVTVTWAAGQMPVFDAAPDADNQYEVTVEISGAPNHTVTVNVQEEPNNAPTNLAVAGSPADNSEDGSDRQLLENGGADNDVRGDSVADGRLTFTDVDADHDAAQLWANQDFNIELRHQTVRPGGPEQPIWVDAGRGDGDADNRSDDAVTALTSSNTGPDPSGAHAGKSANLLYRVWDAEHGKLYIYNDKSWRFALNQEHPDIEVLTAGQALTKSFGLKVIDADGGRSNDEAIFTVTITGANDAPVLAAIGPVNWDDTENIGVEIPRVLGTFHATDVDAGSSVTFSVEGAVETQRDDANFTHIVEGTYSRLRYNQNNGEYKLAAKVAAIDALPGGESVSDSFEITATDNTDLTSIQNLVVNVTGANDAPEISMVTHDAAGGASVLNEQGRDAEGQEVAGDRNATGRLTVQDVDADDDPTQLARDFTFTAAQASRLNGTVAENNVSTADSIPAEGAFAANGDKANYVVAGHFGTLQIHADGTWTYTIDQRNEFVEWLRAGDSISERFAVRVSDGTINSDKAFIEVTIIGANDAPRLAAFDAVRWDDVADRDLDISRVEGTFRAPDPDAGSSVTYSVTGAIADNIADNNEAGYTHIVEGVYSRLRYNKDSGEYLVIARAAIIKALSGGEKQSDSYRVTAHDNTDLTSIRDLVVQVTGAADTGLLSRSSTAKNTAATDPAEVLARFEISDPDTDFTADADLVTMRGADAERFAVTVVQKAGAGNENTYIVTVTWAVDQMPAFNPAEGGKNDYRATVQIDGALNHKVAITLKRDPNNAPADIVVAGNPADNSEDGSDRQLLEDGGVSNGNQGDSVADGNLDFTDVDADHDASVLWANQDFNIELRHQTVRPGGPETVWSVVSRGDGDGNPRTVDDAVRTLTANRTGEAPSGDHAGKAAGLLYRVWDVGHGKLYIYNDKSWRFVLNQQHPDVQALTAGQTLTKSFGLKVIDADGGLSAEAIFTVTINGANDAPVISTVTHDGAGRASVLKEQGQNAEGEAVAGDQTATGSLTVQDVDADDDPAQLARDFTFTAAPASRLNGTVAEDNVSTADSIPADGAFAANDDKANYTVAGHFGRLQIHADGRWSYRIDQANQYVQSLGAGDNISERFAVRVSDGQVNSQPNFIKVTINGTNDAPDLAVNEFGVIRTVDLNDTPETDVEIAPVKGALRANDPDAGSSVTYSVEGAVADKKEVGYTHSIGKAYSSLWYNESNGAYKVVAKVAAIDALQAGETRSDRYVVTAQDNAGLASTSQDLMVQAIGADDTGVLSAGSGSHLLDGSVVATNSVFAPEAGNPSATFFARATAETFATNPNEVLAQFFISDPDTNYVANPDLLSRSGTHANLFNIAVRPKPGERNEGICIISVTWAAGQQPSFNPAQNASNIYEMEIKIKGAPAVKVMVTILEPNVAPTGLVIAGNDADNDLPDSDRQLVAGTGPKADSVADGTLNFSDANRVHDASALWANQDFNIELTYDAGFVGGHVPSWSALSRGDGDGNPETVDDAVRTLTVNSTGTAPSGDHANKAANLLYRVWDVGYGTLYIYDDKSWRFIADLNHYLIRGLSDNTILKMKFGLEVVDSNDGRSNRADFAVTITSRDYAPTKLDFVDDKGTATKDDDAVIQTATIAAGETTADGVMIYDANAGLAGLDSYDGNVDYHFIIDRAGQRLISRTAEVEGVTFSIDPRTGAITKTGGSFADQDEVSPDSSLDLVIRATETAFRNNVTDLVLTVTITNEDERPSVMALSIENSRKDKGSSSANVRYDETFDDDGWMTIATFSFTDPDNPAQGDNSAVAAITKTPLSQSGVAEVRVEGNEVQVRGIDIDPGLTDQQFGFTITPSTSGVGDELSEQFNFTIAVDSVMDGPPARVFDVDGNPSPKADAVAILNFRTGFDKIQLPPEMENVWWYVNPRNGDVTLHHSNNASGANVLAVIKHADGSIQASDFEGSVTLFNVSRATLIGGETGSANEAGQRPPESNTPEPPQLAIDPAFIVDSYVQEELDLVASGKLEFWDDNPADNDDELEVRVWRSEHVDLDEETESEDDDLADAQAQPFFLDHNVTLRGKIVILDRSSEGNRTNIDRDNGGLGRKVAGEYGNLYVRSDGSWIYKLADEAGLDSGIFTKAQADAVSNLSTVEFASSLSRNPRVMMERADWEITNQIMSSSAGSEEFTFSVSDGDLWSSNNENMRGPHVSIWITPKTGDVIRLHGDEGDKARQTQMTGTDRVDYFGIDNQPSTLAEADEIRPRDDGSSSFTRGADKLMLSGLAQNVVWQKTVGSDLILYSSFDADAGDNILLVIKGLAEKLDAGDFAGTMPFQVLDSGPPITHQGTVGTDDFTTNGSPRRIDKFTVDKTPGTKNDADIISGFQKGIDQIIVDPSTKVIWLKRDGDDLLLYAENDYRTGAASSGKILAVLKDFAGSLANDDFGGADVKLASVDEPRQVFHSYQAKSHVGNSGLQDWFRVEDNQAFIRNFEDGIDLILLSDRLVSGMAKKKIWGYRDVDGNMLLYRSRDDAESRRSDFLVKIDKDSLKNNATIDENDFTYWSEENEITAFEIV